jgi:hypothetical protein
MMPSALVRGKTIKGRRARLAARRSRPGPGRMNYRHPQSPSTCSTNVACWQARSRQRNRRTCNSINTGRPATAVSARRRTYRLCTRPDTVPQAGHAARSADARARTTTNSPSTAAFSITTPSTWWNHRSWRKTSPTAVHDRACGDPPWPQH